MESPMLLFEIGAIDQQGLFDFYSKVFGWQRHGESSFVPFAPAPRPQWGALIKAQLGRVGWEKGVTFYIQVDNLETAIKRIQEHGGFIAVEPRDVPSFGFRFAMFKDPEFNLLGIIELMDEASR